MRAQDALAELLARVGAGQGAEILVSDKELSLWPAQAVAAMKANKLMVKARPAWSVVCPGCERECVMPVHTVSQPARTESFIVCDKRSDINRVRVTASRLTQWKATGERIADALAALLGCSRAALTAAVGNQWPVAVLNANGQRYLVKLQAVNGLDLVLAGHVVPLVDVLAVVKSTLVVDKGELMRLVDTPADNSNIETREQRRARLRARIGEEKSKGTRAFLKCVADEERISVSRLKQITAKDEPASNAWMSLKMREK